MMERPGTGRQRLTATICTLSIVAGLALVAVSVDARPAAAADGSIVFILDHDVWIMSGEDPDSARAVTADGTPENPYVAPTQDDHGRIMAVRNDGYGDIVRMDQRGNLLGEPFRPATAYARIEDLDLQPGGEVVAYSSAEFCPQGSPNPDNPGGNFVCTKVDFAYADGRDSAAIANPIIGDYNASWYSPTELVLADVDSGLQQAVGTYTFGADAEQAWFDICGPAEFCFPSHPDVTRARDRVVVALQDSPSLGIPTKLAVYEMTGAPPADPAPGCTATGPESPDGSTSAGEFFLPTWSPDGTALVWEFSAGGFTEPTPEGAGIYLATGFDSGSCLEAFEDAGLLVPGATYPDWSAAALGAQPGPGPDPGPDPGPGPGPGAEFDGDPATTERLAEATGTNAAVAISRTRFADDAAAHAVLSRDDAFPDSLAGASLTTEGPLLFSATAQLPAVTRTELARVLPAGGRVYLLGGTAAISAAVEGQLQADGFDVVRLSGPSRVETALAVASEVRRLHPGGDRVALARASGPPDNPTAGWADSVTGGGWAAAAGVPILVTSGDSLHPAVAGWLQADAPAQTILLGGQAALSAAVEQAVPNPRRVSGAERAATATAIAQQLWGASDSDERRFLILNGWRPDGWQFGLAAGGLASDTGAPLLVVGDDVPPATAQLVDGCGDAQVDLLLVGAETVVSEAVRQALDQLDGGACPGGGETR